MPDPHVEVSKFLSYVLRHAPHAIGRTLDREGWVEVSALVQGARQAGGELDEALVRAVVASNDKQRFALTEDGLRIRAAQGHTTQCVSITYTRKTPPEILYHGTATRFLGAILKEGLKPGRRHHVHLSADAETARNVGKRYGVPVVLKIDAQAMQANGCEFFQADNGVWLVDAVPVEFLKR